MSYTLDVAEDDAPGIGGQAQAEDYLTMPAITYNVIPVAMPDVLEGGRECSPAAEDLFAQMQVVDASRWKMNFSNRKIIVLAASL